MHLGGPVVPEEKRMKSGWSMLREVQPNPLVERDPIALGERAGVDPHRVQRVPRHGSVRRQRERAPKMRENAALDGAPGRSRTCGPRLRRPDEAKPGCSKASQPLATTQVATTLDSTESQVFAPRTEGSADRLRTLLTVREVAAYLRVSTKTVYILCARGDLRHMRVLNAIRVTPRDLQALLLQPPRRDRIARWPGS
jgi:excisionase family DNA binding protein